MTSTLQSEVGSGPIVATNGVVVGGSYTVTETTKITMVELR
jgi:hypothetical protein